ncbi:MAG TPA: hypothetical protein VKV73_25180 [Chloroflexota bacterium]|nr:hypothetical protein [Chloroflexota bacterium]
MQPLRRALFAWLGLAGLLGALLGPAVVAADPLTAWTAGPGAILDPTYTGFIDVPAANATVPTGSFTVAGWFVDQTAQGWAGADDVQVWQGTMDGGGKLLAKAVFAQSRPDVASAIGNPYYAASGFGAVIPAGALSAGAQTLSVYAHTPGKGWWFKQRAVTASASAPATASAPTTSAPAPTVSGGALPTVVIEQPTVGENINTANSVFTIIGYALDPAALPTQPTQGSGIDHVSVYVDQEKDNGGTFVGDADLAFADSLAAANGAQFGAAGWRLDIKPTKFHSGNHNLFIYAHSVVTGKEGLGQSNFNIVEHS